MPLVAIFLAKVEMYDSHLQALLGIQALSQISAAQIRT
jgi:hypothetical protein